MAILTAVFALGKSLSVGPPFFTLINDCPLEGGGGGGGGGGVGNFLTN